MNRKTITHDQRLARLINEVTIYPVSCERLAKGRSDLEWLAAVLAGGAKIVQLRDKESDSLSLYKKALIFRQKTWEAGALFIVNDRLDIALLTEADGVHLGNSDLPAAQVRQMFPELIIGVSCNTLEQAASAVERGASYYNIGPLFTTQTKDGLKAFLGAAAVKPFSTQSDLPFTVMGGIKKEHIAELTDAGARRLAVVTALTQADDIAEETRQWITAINAGIKKNS
ncbi:MAG: thiamine phosphate synthase [Desulfobulbaceae bacterium]|nr:thiamine phosphate synthase [Desulfobulbaceae bacterium]HIJ79579.1 thiamine phosphate synthase [Deltaproteobacteria bacterium]